MKIEDTTPDQNDYMMPVGIMAINPMAFRTSANCPAKIKISPICTGYRVEWVQEHINLHETRQI